MADSKLSALSAATSLATTDLFYVVQSAGSGGVKATLSQLNTLYAGLGANTFTGLQTITLGAANTGVLASTGYSLTGSDATSMVNLAGTWNTSGTPTALLVNVTNTASNLASKLFDFQVGGVSRMRLNVGTQADFQTTDVWWSINNYAGTPVVGVCGSGNGTLAVQSPIVYADSVTSTAKYWQLTYTGLQFNKDQLVAWSASSSNPANPDLYLYRDAAGTLAQRNGANAQEFRLYGTYTDVSNSARLAIKYATLTSGGSPGFVLHSENTGTGSSAGIELKIDGDNVLQGVFFGSRRWYMDKSTWRPTPTNTYDFGTTTNRFQSLYLGQSLTGSATTGAINIATTWNTSGTPSLINIAVTDTASNAASMLIKATVGAATVFGVDKTGKPTFGTHSALAAETVSGYITIVDAGGTTRKLAVVS